MLKTLALTTCLGLILSTPSLAETYTDPDAAWWAPFWKPSTVPRPT